MCKESIVPRHHEIKQNFQTITTKASKTINIMLRKRETFGGI